MAEYLNYRLTQDAVLYFSGKQGVDGLFVPTAFDPKDHGKTGKPGEPRYQLRFLLPEGGVDHLAIMSKIAQAGGGAKGPLVSGEALINQAIAKGKATPATIEKMRKTLAGKVQFSAHATEARRPALGCFVNGVPTNLSTPDLLAAYMDRFYVGALIRVEISAKGYTEFGGGVTGYFNSVFSHGKGERIGGSNDATAFEGLGVEAPAETF